MTGKEIFTMEKAIYDTFPAHVAGNFWKAITMADFYGKEWGEWKYDPAEYTLTFWEKASPRPFTLSLYSYTNGASLTLAQGIRIDFSVEVPAN